MLFAWLRKWWRQRKISRLEAKKRRLEIEQERLLDEQEKLLNEVTEGGHGSAHHDLEFPG